ncbi:hypothetical protein CPLU01_15109 [Colletotrichum plurivorum]|uniref:Uncharacterized protein n=1 Tax=Colletotrichum plurivorum TaxID=2175906 RepID=A0A8H6JF57_9PEZI|nr:hypothetical protein CPLU01_15109 [Colletotrichum plurivorum]
MQPESGTQSGFSALRLNVQPRASGHVQKVELCFHGDWDIFDGTISLHFAAPQSSTSTSTSTSTSITTSSSSTDRHHALLIHRPDRVVHGSIRCCVEGLHEHPHTESFDSSVASPQPQQTVTERSLKRSAPWPSDDAERHHKTLRTEPNTLHRADKTSQQSGRQTRRHDAPPRTSDQGEDVDEDGLTRQVRLLALKSLTCSLIQAAVSAAYWPCDYACWQSLLARTEALDPSVLASLHAPYTTAPAARWLEDPRDWLRTGSADRFPTDFDWPLEDAEAVVLRHDLAKWWARFEVFRSDICDDVDTLRGLDTLPLDKADVLAADTDTIVMAFLTLTLMHFFYRRLGRPHASNPRVPETDIEEPDGNQLRGLSCELRRRTWHSIGDMDDLGSPRPNATWRWGCGIEKFFWVASMSIGGFVAT